MPTRTHSHAATLSQLPSSKSSQVSASSLPSSKAVVDAVPVQADVELDDKMQFLNPPIRLRELTAGEVIALLAALSSHNAQL